MMKKHTILCSMIILLMMVLAMAVPAAADGETPVDKVNVTGHIKDGGNLWSTGADMFSVSGTGIKTYEVTYFKDNVPVEEDGAVASGGRFRAEIHIYAATGYIFGKTTEYSVNDKPWSGSTNDGLSKIVVKQFQRPNDYVVIRLDSVVFGTPVGNTKITKAEVTGVTAPKAGVSSKTGATAKEAGKYKVANAYFNDAGETFACDTEYTVTVVLQAEEGYEFGAASSVSVTVNQIAAKVVSVSSYNKMLMMQATFPRTAPHKEEEHITPASCTENGNSEVRCAVCGEILANGVILAEGHQFKDGVCTVCGEKDPDAKENEKESEKETTAEESTEEAGSSEAETSGSESASEGSSETAESGTEENEKDKEFLGGLPLWILAVPTVLIAGIAVLIVLIIKASKKH